MQEKDYQKRSSQGEEEKKINSDFIVSTRGDAEE